MVRYPLCSLPCTLAKEIQLIPGLGIYSGTFALYLQCQSIKSTGRTTIIVFYAICLLYVLSTVNFVADFVTLILDVSNNSICSKNIKFYQLCRRVLPVKGLFLFILSKAYHPVVVTSSLNVS